MPFGGRGSHHGFMGGAHLGVRVEVVGGEPPLDDGRSHRDAAFGAHDRSAVDPGAGRGQLGTGAHQDDPVDASGVARGQSHRGHAPQR